MNFSPETIEAARLFVSAVRSGNERAMLAAWRFAEDVEGIDPRELDALQIASFRPYYVSPARYSKGNYLVRCPSPDGYKTRASRLIGDGLNCRDARDLEKCREKLAETRRRHEADAAELEQYRKSLRAEILANNRAEELVDKLADASHALAMMGLQSNRYANDMDYRDAVDSVLAAVKNSGWEP